MKKVNEYRCRNCKKTFDCDQGNAGGQVCPHCGSMSIKFVRVKDAEK